MYQGYDYDVDRRQGRSRTGDRYSELDRDRNRWSPSGGGDRRMDADDLYEYRDDDYRASYYNSNSGNMPGRRYYGSGPMNEGWRDRGYEGRNYGPPSRDWDDSQNFGPSYGQNYRDYGNRMGVGQQFGVNRQQQGNFGGTYRNTMSNDWSSRTSDQPGYWQNNYGGPNSWDFQGRNERGQFTGKGPKGYRRSDERIQEDVNEALSRHPHLDASDIEVKVQNGEVRLTGTVTERQCKRMAEDIAESCSGVHDVRNELRVQHSESDFDSPSQQQSKGRMGSGSSSNRETVKA
jgi:hypothetical protein